MIKTDFTVTTNHAIAGGAALVVGYLVYRGYKKAKEVVSKDLNPASKDNIINRGVGSVGQQLTGDKHFTLGGWLYDRLHPNEAERLGLTPIAQDEAIFKKQQSEAII